MRPQCFQNLVEYSLDDRNYHILPESRHHWGPRLTRSSKTKNASPSQSDATPVFRTGPPIAEKRNLLKKKHRNICLSRIAHCEIARRPLLAAINRRLPWHCITCSGFTVSIKPIFLYENAPVAASRYACQLMCVPWFQVDDDGHDGHRMGPPSAAEKAAAQRIVPAIASHSFRSEPCHRSRLLTPTMHLQILLSNYVARLSSHWRESNPSNAGRDT